MLTLVAAGVTVVVALSVVGVPVVDACNGDTRGLIACVRDLLDKRFDLPGSPVPAPGEAGRQTTPAVAEAPVADDTPQEPEQSATAVVAQPIEAPEPAVESEPAPPAAVTPPIPPGEAARAPDAPAPTSPPVAAVPAPPIAAAEQAPTQEAVAVPPPEQTGPVPGSDLRGPFKMGDREGVSETGIKVAPSVDVAAVPESVPTPATAPPPEATAIAPESPVEPAMQPPMAATERGDAPAGAAAESVVPLMPSPGGEVEKSDEQSVANIEEPSSKAPEGPVTLAPILPPTIDAVEIDGDENFVAGDGPAGAVMHLYVDGRPVGESAVEGGRWLVSGPGLLSKPRQELRVDAVDPETGAKLASTTVTFEIELPEPEIAPTPAVPTEEPAAPQPSPAAVAPSPAPQEPTSESPVAETSPAVEPEPAPPVEPEATYPTEIIPSVPEQSSTPVSEPSGREKTTHLEGSVMSPPVPEEAPSIQELPMAPPPTEAPGSSEPPPAQIPPPAPDPAAPVETPPPERAAPPEAPAVAAVPAPTPGAPAIEPSSPAPTQAPVIEESAPSMAGELDEPESPSVAVLPEPAEPATISPPPPSAEPEAPATPTQPAVNARLSVPEVKPAPAAEPQQQVDVAAAEPPVATRPRVIRLVPFGRPQDGRFISGKAIIRRGDTLWDIARRYYGHGIHYKTIFRANRDLIRRPGRIYPGQVFELPLVTDD